MLGVFTVATLVTCMVGLSSRNVGLGWACGLAGLSLTIYVGYKVAASIIQADPPREIVRSPDSCPMLRDYEPSETVDEPDNYDHLPDDDNFQEELFDPSKK